MKQTLFVASACVVLATAALAQTSPAQSPPAQSPSPQAPAAQAPAPQSPSSQAAPGQTAPSRSAAAESSTPSTADFVNKAGISGIFEIQSSRMAMRKHAPADRKFAEHMVRDHQRIAEQLKQIVRKQRVDAQVPKALDDQHQKMLDQLRGENGASFEKDYDQMQKEGHEQAVALFQAYAQNGDNPALKNWAAKTLPTLKEHLSMAEKLT
jgi:putative membrane protein